MPCLWGRHNKSQIFLDVSIFDQATINNASPVSASNTALNVPRQYRALVDTGAQTTMISQTVINTVGLKSLGKIPLQGIGHIITWHNGYLFHVGFTLALVSTVGATPGTSVPAMTFVHASAIYGGMIGSTGGVFDVLLGMDVIGTGSLKVDGDGSYSFSI